MRLGSFTPGVLRLALMLAVAAISAPAGALRAEAAVPEHAEATAGGEAHDAGGHGAINYDEPPINPDRAMFQLFVFSLVLFAGFLFVARAMIWKPLIQSLDEREGRINHAYAEAESAKAEAARLLAAHDAKMSEVHEQVKGIVAQARQQADAEKAQIIASAEADAKAVRERALAEIAQARDEAMAGLAASVDRHVGLATEHILGHQLN